MSRLSRLGCGSAAAATDFGAPTQFLIPTFQTNTTGTDTTGFDWSQESAHTNGGYLGSTALNDYITMLVLAHPQGSIWGLRVLGDTGPDFGITRVAIASVGYQLASRPSGSTSGKIQDRAGGYGTSPSYKQMVQYDLYSAGLTVGGLTSNGFVPFIPGGAEGAVLSSLSAGGTDPYTGYHISDGGPGWYLIRFLTVGKNGASTGYKIRLSDIVWHRVADDGWP